VLDYPQKQLCRTATSRLVQGKEDSESITQLYMVAILPADGLGQEDAVVGNKASFERGLGASTKYTVMREVANAHGNSDREYFCYPPEGPALVNRKAGSPHAIDKTTGMLKIGTILQPGDISCGKVLDCVVHRATPGTGETESVRRVIDRSSVWKGNGPAVVDMVREVVRNGITTLIIRLRESHTPEVGDKFSSLAAQKGVMSAMWSQENMPFTSEGYVPDLIFSSHGLSSRMTIGMLREMVGTQIAIVEGREFDATAFRLVPTMQQDIAAREGLGMHTFMCGRTGKIIGRGFMCMASYMLQRHTVAGKVHARARGPRNAVTKQPVEGRSKGGGLKFGTMEMSTLASSGCIATLNETMTLHDGRDCIVCGCGRVMEVKRDDVEDNCGGCDGTEGKPRTIFIPHVTLVLYWELLSSGVEMRFIPDTNVNGGVRLEPPVSSSTSQAIVEHC
jgi:DNA-directed RNA polymerase II subunit RPB2